MNDQSFSAELAAVLAADAPLLALIPSIAAGGTGVTVARPSLIVSGEYEPYLQRRKGMLHLELRSRLGDQAAASAASEDDHYARFLAVWTKLFGAQGANEAETRANLAAAKVALKAALAARLKVTLLEYGPARDAVSASADEQDLITTIKVAVAWAFQPPA